MLHEFYDCNQDYCQNYCQMTHHVPLPDFRYQYYKPPNCKKNLQRHLPKKCLKNPDYFEANPVDWYRTCLPVNYKKLNARLKARGTNFNANSNNCIEYNKSNRHQRKNY